MTSDVTRAPGNRLLAALPPVEYQRLRPTLEPVALRRGEVLYDPGETITHVYFPITAVVSHIILMEDGTSVETVMVGNDGLVGLPLALGLDHDTSRAMAQVAGTALCLPAPIFRAALDRNAALRDLLGRYTQVVLLQTSQTAACNKLHAVSARCARWLLMTHDRVEADDFPLTQGVLAGMLAVRRPTISTAAETLQEMGLIAYHRGHVTIRDRAGLEAAACECYRAVADATDDLLGATGGTTP